MKTKIMNWGKKIMKVIGIIFIIIILLGIIGFIINKVFFKDELSNIKPYGEIVNVDGKKMHGTIVGEGEQTIVILPGLGDALPTADYAPLQRKLSEKYKVVILDYFGTGFSDETDKARTNENITEEIRTALSELGLKPPYILMPHSISGVYSEYYANKYPNEIAGIISLDGSGTGIDTSTPTPPSFIFKIGKIQQATGLTRLLLKVIPETKLIENGYTEKEIEDYNKFTCHSINDTYINQSIDSIEAIKEMANIPFPKDIPVLKLVSKQVLEMTEKQYKGGGQAYNNDHLKRLGENATSVTIDGTHLYHQTNIDDIVNYTNEFIENKLK